MILDKHSHKESTPSILRMATLWKEERTVATEEPTNSKETKHKNKKHKAPSHMIGTTAANETSATDGAGESNATAPDNAKDRKHKKKKGDFEIVVENNANIDVNFDHKQRYSDEFV